MSKFNNIRSKREAGLQADKRRRYLRHKGKMTWAERHDPRTNLKRSQMSMRLRPRDLAALRRLAKSAGTTKTALARGAVKALVSQYDGPFFYQALKEGGFL